MGNLWKMGLLCLALSWRSPQPFTPPLNVLPVGLGTANCSWFLGKMHHARAGSGRQLGPEHVTTSGARLPAHITKALVFQVRSDRATSSLLTAMISIYPIRKENI